MANCNMHLKTIINEGNVLTKKDKDKGKATSFIHLNAINFLNS